MCHKIIKLVGSLVLTWSLCWVSFLGTQSFAQLDINVPGLSGLMPDEQKTSESFSVTSDVVAQGKSFYVTLHLDHGKNYHAYFMNPGSVGMAPDVSLKAPERYQVEGPYWSVPHVGIIAQDCYYGSDIQTFTWKVTPEEGAQEKPQFAVTASWQVCGAEGCLMPTSPETWNFTLGSPEVKIMPLSSQVALPLGEEKTVGWVVGVKETSEAYLLTIKPNAGEKLTNVYFYSATGQVLPTEKQKIEVEQGSYVLTLPKNKGENELYPILNPESTHLSGVLSYACEGHGEICGVWVSPELQITEKTEMGVVNPSGNVPLAPESSSSASEKDLTMYDVEAGPLYFSESQSFLSIAIALFIGGFILNFMPCVFPVIGLKVMSFVKMGGGQRKKVMFHSLVFVLGVLVSFWIITGLLIILKESIPHINWAFWLENPWVIYAVLLLMLGLGLNMAGVYEIGVGATSVGANAQQKEGPWGSFFSGVLATVVATPCSAPFLGASMGPAMSLSSGFMFVVFTCMGIGMSLPYLVLGFFPNLADKLPKPGAWMESFKQGLSFLLFGTAAWLLWTYMAFFPETDPLSSLTMLLGLVVLSMACWIYGRWFLPYKSKGTRRLALVLSLLCVALGGWMSYPYSASDKRDSLDNDVKNVATESDAKHMDWHVWSLEAQNKALEEGHPVFVDFTARWCATCQVNKSMAYNNEVQTLFKKFGIIAMRADKTTSNKAIDDELKKLHRAAVPVNVLYIPGKAEPIFTQTNLTSGYMVDFLEKNLGNK